MAPHSRSMLCSRFAVNFASLQTKGARECRVHGAPAVSCASPTKENAHDHTGTPKSPGIPARNGFTDYHVLSPARPPGVSPSPAEFLPPACCRPVGEGAPVFFV